MALPTLKWLGGKRGLIDDIKSEFPSNYNTYHEPFFGGGAVFFSIEPSKATINDTNERLINYYNQIKQNPEDVIDKLKSFDDPESDPNSDMGFSDRNRKGKKIEQYYYQMREIFNKRPNNENFDLTEEAAILQYLNRTCFNGLYRENNSGEFNSPIGRYENPDWVLENRVLDASSALSSTKIFNKNFTYILDEAEEGDLVYFDPPYKPISKTASFTEYSAGGFGEDEQMRLAEVVEELDNMNVNFVLSNSGIMHDEYNSQFKVKEVMGDRSISCKGDERGSVEEILVSNK